jgi:hypothetical protein
MRNLYLSQLPDDLVYVDRLLLALELTPSPEVDIIPGNRRNVQDLNSSSKVTNTVPVLP